MEDIKALRELIDLTNLVSGVCEVIQVKKTRRSCGVRKIFQDRETSGYYKVTFLKMKDGDPGEFFKQCRMNRERFDFLLSLIEQKLLKRSRRAPISPGCRLAVTLTYLAQGVTVQYLAWSFKLGKETVRQIILETCDSIWKSLHPLYVTEPTRGDFEIINQDFERKWGVPHCIGSIDGKHIAIDRPRSSGALFYNYKKFYSIVLLGACDARYTFTFIDVGGYGGNSDGGVFLNSKFGRKILKEQSDLPVAAPLPGSEIVAPKYFVADAAFPLAVQIMKPYVGNNLTSKQEVYNKMICRARQTIENTFGILTARWRILRNTINMNPVNADNVVLACVALHNFIMMDNFVRNEHYCPTHYADWVAEDGIEHPGMWRDEVQPLLSVEVPKTQRRFNGTSAINLRNNLCEYFSL